MGSRWCCWGTIGLVVPCTVGLPLWSCVGTVFGAGACSGEALI